VIAEYPYPLARPGGLFLVLAGAAIVSGALFPRYRVALLGGGLLIASAATALATPRLILGLGRPTHFQVLALFSAVLLEAVTIPLAVRATRHRDECARWLAVFFVVGLHFLPMGVAFGPLAVALGLAIMLNAGVGLWRSSRATLRPLWLTDGLLKVTAGMMMLLDVALC
jgi:hypothetical protein